MANDFAGIKQAVRDLSPTQIGNTTAGKAVNEAYQALLRGRPGGGVWFGLKTSVVLTMLPDRTGGTVTLTQGSPVVIGSGTAFAGTDALRFLKLGARVPLRVESVESATQLTLLQPWGEATLTGSTYNIMSTRYQLPSDADRVIRLVGPQWPLKRMTYAQIDVYDPGRNVRGDPLIFQEMELLLAQSTALAQSNVLSGQVSVPAGATSVTVALAAGTSGYSVSGSPSWNTSWDTRAGRTSVSFTIDFAVPAPAGAVFDWVAVVPGAVAGLSVVETTTEIEVWPVPAAYSTLALEYRKRVDDLINDSDVPVIAPELVRFAAQADVAARLFTRTGDDTWNQAAQTYGARAAELLGPVVREDRKLRGALNVVLDSEDASPLGNADWLLGWRMYSALFGGPIAT